MIDQKNGYIMRKIKKLLKQIGLILTPIVLLYGHFVYLAPMLFAHTSSAAFNMAVGITIFLVLLEAMAITMVNGGAVR
jgi:hypothetical protein